MHAHLTPSWGPLQTRLSVLRHVGAKARRAALSSAGWGRVARGAFLDAALIETSLWLLGRQGILDTRNGFLPTSLLPAYHGPHFDEALRRLVLPSRGPFVTHLAITGTCPSQCAYCYASAGGGKGPDIGDEGVLEVARSLARAQVPLVMLTGGEPMTRFSRVEKVVQALSATSEVRLLTSGVGLTAKRATRLKELGLNVVAVSLDTDDPGLFNALRGHNAAFARATSALRASASAGLLTIASCVVGQNRFTSQDEVRRFLDFVRSLHPDIVVSFVPQLPSGRGDNGNAFDSSEAFASTAARIARVINSGRYRALVVSHQLDRFMGCVGAGGKQLYVDAKGNVNVCVSRGAMGNVLDEPFDVIYDRYVRSARRLKSGYFCAATATSDTAAVMEVGDSLTALRHFFKARPDSAYQRLLDGFGPVVQWLAA